MFDSTELVLMGVLVLLIVIGPLRLVRFGPAVDKPRHDTRRPDGVLLNTEEEDAFRIQIMRRQHNRNVAAARMTPIDSAATQLAHNELASKSPSDSIS